MKGFYRTLIDLVFFILYSLLVFISRLLFWFQGCSEEMLHKLHGIDLAF